MITFSRSHHFVSIVTALVLLGVWWAFHRDGGGGEVDAGTVDRFFVEVQGVVVHPGIYSFDHQPLVREVLSAAGGLSIDGRLDDSAAGAILSSGTLLSLSVPSENTVEVTQTVMTAGKRVFLGIPLDLNSATARNLESVPGIGQRQAEGIVRLRERKGPLSSVDDVLQVRGIGPDTLNKLKPFVKTGP
jgi:competence protein ComEA